MLYRLEATDNTKKSDRAERLSRIVGKTIVIVSPNTTMGIQEDDA